MLIVIQILIWNNYSEIEKRAYYSIMTSSQRINLYGKSKVLKQEILYIKCFLEFRESKTHWKFKSSSKEIHIFYLKFSLSFFCISPSLQKYICLKNIFLKNTLPNWENKSSFTRFALRDFGVWLMGKEHISWNWKKKIMKHCVF